MKQFWLFMSAFIAALWAIRPPRTALPRLIKFAQHPFVKKGHARVLAGGSGLSFSNFSFGAVAIAAVCIFAILVSVHSGNDPGGILLAAGPTLLVQANELKVQRAAKADEARGLVTAAEAENRNLTDEERTKYEAAMAAVKTLGQRAQQLEEQHTLEAELGAPESRSRPIVAPATDTPNDKKEFRDFGEFMHAVRFRRNDPRLQDLYSERVGGADTEDRAQSMGTDESGGFAVPKQFSAKLLEVTPGESLIEPRATVIPAGDPPDAAIDMIALDQSAENGMYGGVQMEWIEEGGDKPETDAKIKQITLTPHELAGTIVVTDKLLRNWKAAGPLLERLLRGAMNAAKDHAYFTGNGDGKPTGPINHPSAFEVARAGVGVTFEDIVAMLARIKMGGNLIWTASQAILPSIATLKDENNNNIFVANARDGIAGTLMGYPIKWNDRSPLPGEDGDLMLADWAYYLIKHGSGPFVAASEHVLFRTNKTVIKAFLNTDGKPWLNDVITTENGWEVSPFVVLGDGVSS